MSLFNFTMKDAYRSDEVVNIDPSQRLVEWWLLLLDQSGCLVNTMDIIHEGPETDVEPGLLLAFVTDGIPHLGEKYGFGERAQEIVSKRFEEVEKRYELSRKY